MSTKKKSKSKLEELFSASSFGVCLYIKSNLHKILDNFYLNGFHIEEMTSYDSSIVLLIPTKKKNHQTLLTQLKHVQASKHPL